MKSPFLGHKTQMTAITYGSTYSFDIFTLIKQFLRIAG